MTTYATKQVNKTVNNSPKKAKTLVSFKYQTETSKHINHTINLLAQNFKECVTDKKAAAVEYRACLSLMKQETKIIDGYITMPLPFKHKPPRNSSFKTAKSRFNSLLKLSKNQNLEN